MPSSRLSILEYSGWLAIHSSSRFSASCTLMPLLRSNWLRLRTPTTPSLKLTYFPSRSFEAEVPLSIRSSLVTTPIVPAAGEGFEPADPVFRGSSRGRTFPICGLGGMRVRGRRNRGSGREAGGSSLHPEVRP